jgi:hypothetical protein
MSLFIAEMLAGAMVGWHFWAAVVIITCVLSVFAVRVWFIAPQPPFRLFMRHGIDMETQLADARMEKAENGIWLYIDKDWYIALRSGVACVLYAPLIDHAQPIKSATHIVFVPRYSRVYYTLCYVARDGTRVETRFANVGDQLNEWFNIHGLKLGTSYEEHRIA